MVSNMMSIILILILIPILIPIVVFVAFTKYKNQTFSNQLMFYPFLFIDLLDIDCHRW